MKDRQQILHIHGGSSFNSYDEYIENLMKWDFKMNDLYRLKRWSRNYEKFLDNEKFDIVTPIMPSKNNAKYIEWKIWFEKSFEFLNNNLILVGHSLGFL